MCAETIEIQDTGKLPDCPLVSVYITTYNHERYIGQALDGVLTQEVDFPIELIVGEDCSVDGTVEIVLGYQKRYPDVIRVITSKSNVGPFLNARRCRERCKGTLIARLDGDDYWLPGKLNQQVSYLEKNRGCAAVYTNSMVVNEAGGVIGLFNNYKREKITLAELLRSGNFLNNSSMVHRAEFMPDLLAVEAPFIDYSAHLRLAQNGYLAQLRQPLTVYRRNTAGGMVSNSAGLVRELYWEAINDVPRELVSDKDYAVGVSDFMKRVCLTARKTGNWKIAKEWMPKVLDASPYGKIKTGWMIFWLIIKAVPAGFKDWFFCCIGMRHKKVFHH